MAPTPAGFTHVDPFEDTESFKPPEDFGVLSLVSPTSIRSRILKANSLIGEEKRNEVSPTSIRSRILKGT